mmetsp:Transcript_78523/g.163143  ORF Transcript_78523/g.163143 Transcript_78523/m.163143 type:complete len:335 (-) Transcript_78523:111-1115(-)
MSTTIKKWRRFAAVAWLTVPPLIFIKDRYGWVYRVKGRSMSPTLNPQDSFVDRMFSDHVLVLKNCTLQKGDIIVCRDPTSNLPIVKRLISQGNEFVKGADGTTYTYVPPGACWVEGDNPEVSVDSRSFDAIPKGLVDALVVAVVWPFWRARWMDLDGEVVSAAPNITPSCTGDDVPTERKSMGGVPMEAFLTAGDPPSPEKTKSEKTKEEPAKEKELEEDKNEELDEEKEEANKEKDSEEEKEGDSAEVAKDVSKEEVLEEERRPEEAREQPPGQPQSHHQQAAEEGKDERIAAPQQPADDPSVNSALAASVSPVVAGAASPSASGNDHGLGCR